MLEASTSHHDAAAETERLLRERAKAEGLSYHAFCERYGILGPTQERRIRRHEVNESDLDPTSSREVGTLTGNSNAVPHDKRPRTLARLMELIQRHKGG